MSCFETPVSSNPKSSNHLNYGVPLKPVHDEEDCRDKFHKVLAALLNRNFKINNDVYLEMMLSHLAGKYDCEHRKLLRSPEVSRWLNEALSQWEGEAVPSADIAAFTLRILAMTIDNECFFVEMQSRSMLDRLQECIRRDARLQHPSVRLGHVMVLKAVSLHASGLDWIKRSGSWKICLDYYNGQSQTVYIMKETSLFLYEVLERFGSIGDYDLVLTIVRSILSPLLDGVWKSPVQENAVLVNDENAQRILSSMLSLLCTLFRKMLDSAKQTRAAYFMLITFHFERNLWVYADSIQDHTFLATIYEVLILANCTRLRCMDIPPEDTVAIHLPFEKYTINFLNFLNFSIRRGNIENLLLMAQMHHQAWRLLGDRAPEEVVLKHQSIKFGDQILLIQLFPAVYEIKSVVSSDPPDYIEKFISTLYDISCEYTVRLLYACRDVVEANHANNATQLAIKSIQGIASIQSLPRQRAIIAFQAFVYVLKEFLPDMCYLENQSNVCNTDQVLAKPNLLAAIITGLHTLIQNYKFTWNECIESTTVVNFMLNLLGNPNLPPRHVVLALKLTQLSIEYFLAPNLALLMDNLNGSGLEFVGRVIYKRLHDGNWEVRDSALELLASIVEISEIKFPSFQKLILDCDIIPVVEAAAKNDTEPYVRASALRCLSLMVRIRLLWEHSLSKLNLMNHLIITFDTESEGIVRREAVNTVREIYSNHKILPHCLDSVFSVLAFSTVNDLYWEVQINALQFWRVVMCRQFQHQGMIDGTFPSVTFSKEHKKIITLTNKEILLRLRKVLNELSLRGCLGVLLACLQEDCDLEVVKNAVEIIQRLMGYLNKYNFLDEYRKVVDPATGENSIRPLVSVLDTNYSVHVKTNALLNNTQRNDADYSSGNVPCLINSEEIIDSIVNLDDVNLLSISYKNNLKVAGETSQANSCSCESSKVHYDLFKKYAQVTADDFLDRVQQIDFHALISSRQQWMQATESFSSLLDDVLFSYYAINVNDADCY
ncbi:uncharacterized protein LOC131676779 [Topomyia yanbarensis]|uniref:uncharacterized protein LOC131676779 n=1 Tax=Topomyia yanbarensis TaxID=2498891 RepID=UPI00273B3F46|nr:uncharacterized protein LOC131676779 [Topomyia yanbarensis]